MDFADDFLPTMARPMTAALEAMQRLEAGEIANVDENRMVGHYWLRDARRAPTPDLQEAIASAIEQVTEFAADVHRGAIAGERGPFRRVLLIGIGGSALGPQFVSAALGHALTDKLAVHFFDNTDPDGMDRTLAPIVEDLGRTLVIVISKSGSTPETRNGMIEARDAWRRAGLAFEKHAVAVTEADSQLDRMAREQRWLASFPMWEWVGGRTSVTSAVGLLPAALQGIPIERLLEGARACDEVTRSPDPLRNPAALLALAWYHATSGRGARDMVVLPYKDRLELFSRYLQQLVMESLGKELDLQGRVVHQGISVYGNKGSTDQHAYVQQLRDGIHNFFVVFIRVLRGRAGDSPEVENGITSADYLNGFLLGTRAALHEKGRESLTITLPEVSPFTVGSLIALFERAVGLYAFLVGINAYHQPGVQAGKTAAASILKLQASVLAALRSQPSGRTAVEIAQAIGAEDPVMVFDVCQHLAANHPGITRSGDGIDARFGSTSRS